MFWLYLAIIAYFINASVFIIDKYLLAAPIPKYNAYAFGVSLLSLSAVVLIPFGVSWHGLGYFMLTVATGAIFFVGLIFFYKVIRQSDASVAATQVGTIGAVSTYVFSILILKDVLPRSGFVAFLLLILGIFLLGKAEKRFFVPALTAGTLFGLYFVLLKLSFNLSDFVNSLFWTRMGFVGAALATLTSAKARGEIRDSYRNAPKRSKFVFVLNKILAGSGFIVLYFAISLGNVSLVNALLGIQFVFTFIIALVLRDKLPGIKEDLSGKKLGFKLAGMAFVLVGLLLLFN